MRDCLCMWMYVCVCVCMRIVYHLQCFLCNSRVPPPPAGPDEDLQGPQLSGDDPSQGARRQRRLPAEQRLHRVRHRLQVHSQGRRGDQDDEGASACGRLARTRTYSRHTLTPIHMRAHMLTRSHRHTYTHTCLYDYMF